MTDRKHDVRLMDRETHEEFTDSVRMIFLSLRKVPKEWEDCDTQLEKLLYLIKNMHTMSKESKAYQGREFEPMFEAASLSSLSPEDIVPYSQSLMKLKEDRRAVEYAARTAEAKGKLEGRLEGKLEGRLEGKREGKLEGILEVAKNMLSDGLSLKQVAKFTRLPESQLQTIL